MIQESRPRCINRFEKSGLGDQPPMMGYIRPPEPLEDLPFSADDGRTINLVMRVVRDEAEVPGPDVDLLEQEASKLRDIASRLGQWLKQRLDKVADAFTPRGRRRAGG